MHDPIFRREREKREAKGGIKSSFQNQKLISKKSDFKQYTLGEAVITNNIPQLGS